MTHTSKHSTTPSASRLACSIALTCVALSAAGCGADSDCKPQDAAQAEGTLYVSDSCGSDDNPGSKAAPLATIARAGEIAVDGDVIVVGAGTYPESVRLNHGVRVVGAGFGETVINPPEGQPGIVVNGPNGSGPTKIEGLRVTDASGPAVSPSSTRCSSPTPRPPVRAATSAPPG